MGVTAYREEEEDEIMPSYRRQQRRIEAEGSFFEGSPVDWKYEYKNKKSVESRAHLAKSTEFESYRPDSDDDSSVITPESTGPETNEEEPLQLQKDINHERIDKLEFVSVHSVPAPPRTCGDFKRLALLHCTVRRTKTLWGCQLELKLDSTGRTILLAKRRRRSGNYHIFHVGRGNLGTKLNKKGANYLGKLAPAQGAQTAYQRVLVDNVQNDNEIALYMHRRTRPISALVDGAKPRQICVVLPPQAEPHEQNYGRNQNQDNDKISNNNKPLLRGYLVGDPSLTVLHQLEPRLVDGQYSLNFHGRARVPSVKNCQIVRAHTSISDASPEILLQVGKVHTDLYNIDFAAPFTPLTAFAFAVCQFLR